MVTRAHTHRLLAALLLLFALALARQAHGQAWTQSPGHAYLKLAYGSATASEQYAFDGRTKLYADDVLAPSFFDRSVYLYGEVGVLDGLTASFSLPYKRLTVNDTTFRYDAAAVGDLALGLRARLPAPLGLAAAVNLTVGLPTGYVRNTVPSPGNGQVDASATLDVGRGLSSWAYVQGGAGYRLRSGWYGLSSATPCQAGRDRGCTADTQPDLGDELVGRLEVGVRPFGPVLLQLMGSAVISVDKPAVGFSAEQPFPMQQRFVKVGAGLAVDLHEHLGLSAQGFVTPWGQNTVRSVDVFVGVHTAFDLWGV
ncbi:MAG: hypothetical protein H6702_07325 [Myxococcales bacterium]|nr:hypothetical protein [Myxococcales bacterium]